MWPFQPCHVLHASLNLCNVWQVSSMYDLHCINTRLTTSMPTATGHLAKGVIKGLHYRKVIGLPTRMPRALSLKTVCQTEHEHPDLHRNLGMILHLNKREWLCRESTSHPRWKGECLSHLHILTAWIAIQLHLLLSFFHLCWKGCPRSLSCGYWSKCIHNWINKVLHYGPECHLYVAITIGQRTHANTSSIW